MWLEKSTVLRGKIPCTILTVDGAYRCEDEDFIYLLFDFIDGETLCKKVLGKTQVHQLAEIIAELHNNGGKSVPPINILETFDVSFCDNLRNVLNYSQAEYPVELKGILGLYTEPILVKIKELKELADYLRSCNPQFVLCDTDIHGWNVMQASQLMLIDWEGLKLAPPEADLFSFTRNLSI